TTASLCRCLLAIYVLLLVYLHLFFSRTRRPPISTLFPYTTLFRSAYGRFHSIKVLSKSVIIPLIPRSFNCSGVISYTFCTYSLRSEEHTSELQSRFDLVCRLLLEKKKKQTNTNIVKIQYTTELH